MAQFLDSSVGTTRPQQKAVNIEDKADAHICTFNIKGGAGWIRLQCTYILRLIDNQLHTHTVHLSQFSVSSFSNSQVFF